MILTTTSKPCSFNTVWPGYRALRHCVASTTNSQNWRGWDSPLKSVCKVGEQVQVGIENVGQESILFRLALQGEWRHGRI